MSFQFLANWCNRGNCTCFPDGTWTECCARHDRRYENKRLSRKQADLLLFRCVKKKSVIIATIMYIGVRLWGSKHYNEINKG